MYDAVQDPHSLSPTDIIEIHDAVTSVHNNPLFQEGPARDLIDRFNELREAVQMVAAYQFTQTKNIAFEPLQSDRELDQSEYGQAYVNALMKVLDWLQATVKLLDQLFRSPILE